MQIRRHKWPSRNKKEAQAEDERKDEKGWAPGRGTGQGWRSLIQVGNPATPSNETDRLSYLHRLASINSRGWYTHTKAPARVYIPRWTCEGDARAVTSGQPTRQPPIYLRPKRNSRIYFTYALLPPYFQLYGHGPRAETTGRKRERGSETAVHARTSWLTKDGAENHALCFFSALSCVPRQRDDYPLQTARKNQPLIGYFFSIRFKRR